MEVMRTWMIRQSWTLTMIQVAMSINNCMMRFMFEIIYPIHFL